MSKKQQTKKNLDLTVKLSDFIASHPELYQTTISGVSIVPFSATDQKLNTENEKLVEGLLEEGKRVVKAQETKNKNTPWEFIPV